MKPRNFILLIFVFMFTLQVSQASANNLKLEKCQESYEELTNLDSNDLNAQIRFWTSISVSCRGTGLYEYILGKLYINTEEYEKALLEFDRGLEYKSPYMKELSLGVGDTYLAQKKYSESSKIYEEVTKQYPDWWAGYSYLGLAQLGLGDYKKASINLEIANSHMEQASTFRNLGLAYFYQKQFKKSYESIDRAFSLDEKILADRDAMLAAARSQIELGNYQLAKTLLKILLSKNSDLQNDNEFIRAVLYLKEKTTHNKKIKQDE
jgi:tetratricopeptide (TPR) repeat protein